MLIAQITDTHIMDEGVNAYGVFETAPYLERAVDHLLTLDPAPDLVMVTGDLVDRGKPSEYARLRRLLSRLPMPVYVLPGNHDSRDAMRASFADAGYLPRDGFLHYTVEDTPLRLIALDTLLPGQGGGQLCPERIGWIADRLTEQPERPTVLFMHHPPFRTSIAHLDRAGLAGAPALAAVLRRFANVERVICGHTHRAIQTRFAGTIAMTTPSIAHQAILELRPDGPAEFDLAPPGFALHHWSAEDGMRSHVVTVGTHPGPYFFNEAQNRAAGRI